MPRCASWTVRLLVAIALTSLPAAAQGTAPRQDSTSHPRYRIRPPAAPGEWNLFAGIELTPEQMTNVRVAYRARQAELYLLFEKGRHPSNRSAMADSIAVVQRAQLAEMRAVLNPGQQIVFDRNVTTVNTRARQLRASSPTNP